jgi:UDP-N-acetylmuramoyl-L-alanyl-D-glutamate--2,6-diaminopimelate ligase
MGEVAAKFADYIYLTDDETYSENGDAIRKAVLEGIEQQGELKKCTEIADRRDAIKQAFADAKKGDVVILAGIGHQDYRAMGSTKLAWDEREVARDVLRGMDNERKT